MKTPKQDVRDLLDRLPDDVSMEQIIYHTFVIARVRAGLEDIERGDVITHEEVKRRLDRWGASGGTIPLTDND